MDTTQEDATPEKNWPVWAPAALDALRAGMSNSRSARAAGVDPSTVWRLTQRDEAFAVAASDAREEGIDSLIDIATLRAKNGQPWEETITTTKPDGTVETRVKKGVHISDNLLMFRVKKERPEYRESYRVEQTGAGGGPIQIQTVDIIDARIAQLADELARRAVPVEADE